MKDMRIAGLGLKWFVIVAGIIVAGCALGAFPTGMVGAFLFLMVFGDLLNVLGNVTPIIKTFLGGGAIVSIFGGAAIVYWNLLPASVVENCSVFMKSAGFLDFYIAALITGSILGMERKLLVRAAIRYLPCIMGAVGLALIGVSVFGKLFSMSSGEAIAYIGIPIMGGGMGAGAVPISKVFESALNIPSEAILGRLVPAVALGNAFAIVCGGLLNRLGNAFPSLTGNGRLVISNDDSLKEEKTDPSDNGMEAYATGLIVSAVFYALGAVLAAVVKKTGLDIHPYAWMILSVAAVKSLNLIPRKYEENAQIWYKFVSKNWTAALMLGISVAYTDMGQIIAAFNPTYLVLVIVTVSGAVIGSAAVGRLVGFYPIEAAVTAGLCMANMGGTGDVAVLMAAKRMELMPFAQISSRLGGAFIILFASFLVPIFFGH
ncbi:MAG: 2-hydroxycarboxylate transporter family protein [Alphaproteobacteria bacterium]|nr:2-hydroxycarboxylate transporter family protein [Alphaproteobacteria bacterium]